MSRGCFWRRPWPCYVKLSQRRLVLNSGVESMSGRVKLAACFSISFACPRRPGATTDDRRSAGSLQHEAGRTAATCRRAAPTSRPSIIRATAGSPISAITAAPTTFRRRSIRMTGKAEPNGTSIVDVTDPAQPKYLRHIPGAARQVRSRRRADGARVRRQAPCPRATATPSTCCAPSAARRTRSGTSPIPPSPC